VAEGNLRTLRTALDAAISGQEEAKTGLLLAWLAREHAYLEGPPGCGKTALAEAWSHAIGAPRAFHSFSRETRVRELLGDVELRRTARDAGQRISMELSPGPLLGAEVAVLDDLARAPGEALAALLELLSERRVQGRELPLGSVVATGVPPETAAIDALTPGMLDRFAIQVRMHGLLNARDWSTARRLLDEGQPPTGRPAIGGRVEWQTLQRATQALPVPGEVRERLLEVLARLRVLVMREPGPGSQPHPGRIGVLSAADGGAALSDRSFGHLALRVMRAHAGLRGAASVEIRDLEALGYMLARRVPAALRADAQALVEGASEPSEPWEEAAATGSGTAPGHGGGPPQDSGASASEPPEQLELDSASELPNAERPGADVLPLLRALEGRLGRGRADLEEDPGGAPRRQCPMRGLEDFFDADPVEGWLYASGQLPELPRVLRRERPAAGGAVAVLRDVSSSMEGRLSSWAGDVVLGVIGLARRARMGLGYVEFNHRVECCTEAGRFFHRGYGALARLAARARCEGRTSYEAPLGAALEAFLHVPDRSRHIILLTDGVPVVGDPEVRVARRLARQLRVKVHTVFIGLGDCPGVLDRLSLETGGLRFRARPSLRGPLRVRERGEI